MRRTVALTMLGFALVVTMASAQDMMRDVDLTSPAMVTAEMSRQEVEAVLAKASADAPADFTGASLKGANLFATQMARAHLDGADLTGARIAADLSGASLVGASIADAHLG